MGAFVGVVRGEYGAGWEAVVGLLIEVVIPRWCLVQYPFRGVLSCSRRPAAWTVAHGLAGGQSEAVIWITF